MEKGSQGNIPIVLLAAGSSSRMGQSKQLLAVNGTTLINKTIETCLAANTGKVIVVLGAREADHRNEIEQHPVDIVHNPEWHKGMGSSIKAGIDYIINHDLNPDGVIIAVCDQPYLSALHLDCLSKEYRNHTQSIVASTYGGIRGVPVLFGSQYFDSLMKIEDSNGANRITKQFSENVFGVPFPDGAIDLDTIEDYHSFITKTN